jgi:hypothetical protein
MMVARRSSHGRCWMNLAVELALALAEVLDKPVLSKPRQVDLRALREELER